MSVAVPEKNLYLKIQEDIKLESQIWNLLSSWPNARNIAPNYFVVFSPVFLNNQLPKIPVWYTNTCFSDFAYRNSWCYDSGFFSVNCLWLNYIKPSWLNRTVQLKKKQCCYCQQRQAKNLTWRKKLQLKHSRKNSLLGTVEWLKTFRWADYEHWITWMEKSHCTLQLPSLTSGPAWKRALLKVKMSFECLCWLSNVADKEILVKARAERNCPTISSWRPATAFQIMKLLSAEIFFDVHAMWISSTNALFMPQRLHQLVTSKWNE